MYRLQAYRKLHKLCTNTSQATRTQQLRLRLAGEMILVRRMLDRDHRSSSQGCGCAWFVSADLFSEIPTTDSDYMYSRDVVVMVRSGDNKVMSYVFTYGPGFGKRKSLFYEGRRKVRVW